MHAWPDKEPFANVNFDKVVEGFFDNRTGEFLTRKQALDRVKVAEAASGRASRGEGLDTVDLWNLDGSARDVTLRKSFGMGEPHPDVLQAMKENAERSTFTTKLTGVPGRLLSVRDAPVNFFGLEVRPGVALAPFFSTPYNVISEAVKRSPLGILRLKGLKAKYKRGEITSQEYHRELAATQLGTLTTVGLIGVAQAGLITGGGPVNQQDRANKIAQGWRPYSLHIPGKGYIPLQRIEPLGTILGMAADIVEFGDSDDKMGKMMATVKDNLTDKTFLYGLESFAKFYGTPEQFGSTYYKQMAGSLIPTMFSKAQQAVDPYARHTEWNQASLGIPDALAYRIPGLSQALPLKSTPLGKPQERWGVGSAESLPEKILSGAQSMVSPLPFSKQRTDVEVEKEFTRLKNYGGMPPGMPKRTRPVTLRGVKGENVRLTDEDYAVFNKYHAKANEALKRIIASTNYHRMPPAYQAQLLSSVYKKFRRAANNEVTMRIRRRTTVGD